MGDSLLETGYGGVLNGRLSTWSYFSLRRRRRRWCSRSQDYSSGANWCHWITHFVLLFSEETGNSPDPVEAQRGEVFSVLPVHLKYGSIFQRFAEPPFSRFRRQHQKSLIFCENLTFIALSRHQWQEKSIGPSSRWSLMMAWRCACAKQLNNTQRCTGWGGHLFRRFHILFSKSSAGRRAILLLPCCPSKQGELLEKHITKSSEQVAAPPSISINWRG